MKVLNFMAGQRLKLVQEQMQSLLLPKAAERCISVSDRMWKMTAAETLAWRSWTSCSLLSLSEESL